MKYLIILIQTFFWTEIAQRDNGKIAKLRTLLVVCMTELVRIYKELRFLPL